MLTPINIVKNWIFNQVELRDTPVNSGNQLIMPVIIAKTAPIDRT
jgi:hypothetical protein